MIDTIGTISTYYDASAWTPTTWFSAMNGANIAYVAGHGNPSVHDAGDGTPIYPWDVTLPGGAWVPGYEQQRIAHIGSGYPSFNSTSKPALNLLYIHACNCGDTNNFIRGCWPYQNGFGIWLENQATVAFNVYVSIADFNTQTAYFFGQLATGRTLYRARKESSLMAVEMDFTVWDVYPGTSRFLAEYDMTIYGDDAMRLTTVYTASQVAPVGWVREVSPW